MPKLGKQQARQVDQATEMTGGFLLEKGRYAARLKQVTVEPGKNASDDGKTYDQWVFEFDGLHDEDSTPRPGRQWRRYSLSPKAMGFLKNAFGAFGYSTDSDTDEMVGEWVVLHIDQEVQSQGKGAGKLRNNITHLAAFDPDEWDFDPDEVPATADRSGGGGGGGAGAAAGDDF